MRLGVAAVLTYDVTTHKVAPKRVLTNSLALGLLTLAAGRGTELLAHVNGSDEEECLAYLTEFFASGFGEAYA